MNIHIPLYLTLQQRAELETFLKSGNAPARVHTRARILLLTDRSTGVGRADTEVAQALLCRAATVAQVRKRCLQEGLHAALVEKPRPGRTPKITGEIEAQLSVIACSDPPQGQARWTMRLLAARVIELGLVDQIDHTTIWERLKKINSSPGK